MKAQPNLKKGKELDALMKLNQTKKNYGLQILSLEPDLKTKPFRELRR